ncbi:RNA-binding protein NOB1 [Eumeta japonica]|uniref:RNA-binding protein NOB1 n=1 Tax=Eumeta variegata TaxID=151549 RepID=A0A4C1YTT1_EUMVA|nr:RNA-binding protein NOB1 [Eumeta japonica]
MSAKRINHLVVDTTAFIKNANLRDVAENIYTVQEVVNEITNDRQRRKLVVLPYDIIVKDVFTENITVITEFAKKTGDYVSLSATDIKIMALTYQLEKEKVGIQHLKTEPTLRKTVQVSGLGKSFEINPRSVQVEKEINSTVCNIENEETGTNTLEVSEMKIEENISGENCMDNSCIKFETKANNNLENQNIEKGDVENDDTSDLEDKIKNMDLKDSEIDNFITRVNEESEESESEEESGSDEGEWITLCNISEKKKEIELGDFYEDKSVEVACITSDFAMQNVLKQMGLNVTSVDGRIIRQLRTFIFRCTTCFKTTSVMTKLFCPKCGHATLKKVSVSVDEEGNQHIHINGRKPLTARGKRFSLPTPKGGQHFQYPILTEDQHIRKRYATQLARKKNNPLDPEYIAGFSPFVMRDVNSKSAVLGIRANKQDIKYWMKHHATGKKKK